MTADDVLADLEAIEHLHGSDRDGGYALAETLCEYQRRMPDDVQHLWDEVLLTWVRDRADRWWGVATQALAYAGGPAVDEGLAALLRDSAGELEWRGYVANTLIRRGYSSDELTAEVANAAQARTPMGLTNLAALLRLAPDLLAPAAACVVTAISSGDLGYVEAHVPPFVHAAADSDPELLVRLVARTEALDRDAGRRFGRMVADYLRKPWVREEFPGGVADGLATRIAGRG